MRIPENAKETSALMALNAFPSSLSKEVRIVIDFLSDKNFDIHPMGQEVTLAGEKLTIPGRVYFDEPKDSLYNDLTAVQLTILNCLYLRHHNGYVRQAVLEKLNQNDEYFITPFISQLLGEYVVQILDVIKEQLTEPKLKNFARFAAENPKYWMLTESRMVSHWNEYYRRTIARRLKTYVGYVIMTEIKVERLSIQENID